VRCVLCVVVAYLFVDNIFIPFHNMLRFIGYICLHTGYRVASHGMEVFHFTCPLFSDDGMEYHHHHHRHHHHAKRESNSNNSTSYCFHLTFFFKEANVQLVLLDMV